MKRVKIDPQELANKHQCWVTKGAHGETFLHGSAPKKFNSWWTSNKIISPEFLYDIQWSEELPWELCCVSPEPTILPCPRGGDIRIYATNSNSNPNKKRWYIESEDASGNTLFYIGYFSTRSEAILVWNAVVREIAGDTKKMEDLLHDAMGLLHNHNQSSDEGWLQEYEDVNQRYDTFLDGSD